jgi:hypothetical protein
MSFITRYNTMGRKCFNDTRIISALIDLVGAMVGAAIAGYAAHPRSRQSGLIVGLPDWSIRRFGA